MGLSETTSEFAHATLSLVPTVLGFEIAGFMSRTFGQRPAAVKSLFLHIPSCITPSTWSCPSKFATLKHKLHLQT